MNFDDLKNLDLKNLNVEDLKQKVLAFADKKTLIKVGISLGSIIVFLIILIGFTFFIYKKVDKSKESDGFVSKYAVLIDKLDTLANKNETFRDNFNKSQIDLSDKLTQKQNTSEKEICLEGFL